MMIFLMVKIIGDYKFMRLIFLHGSLTVFEENCTRVVLPMFSVAMAMVDV